MHDLLNLLASVAMSIDDFRRDARANGVDAAKTHLWIGLGIGLVCTALIFVIAWTQTQ